MKVVFIYPDFERHARAHPELLSFVPCKEYLGPPSLGIASLASVTPADIDLEFVDDRLNPVDLDMDGDLFAISFFTPAATRGLEIAQQLRQRGKKVVVGGVFPSTMPDVCSRQADAVVVGEGEPVWPQVLKDAMNGTLQARYQATEPYDISTAPPPRVDLYLAAETADHRPDDYPLQVSRGCPFRCHACAVPLSMGRKIRYFPQETVLHTAREYARAGKRCSLTEDTSFLFVSGAKRRFRKLLKRVIEERRRFPYQFSYVGISMPLLLSLEEEVFQQVRDAGIGKFYLVCGFDPISREAFSTGNSSAFSKAVLAVKKCQDHGIDPYTSLLAGNPEDGPGVFDRILEFTERAGVERAEFAIATPYPGTPFWKRL